MAATETPETMTDEGRALMTDTERRIIAGEKDVSDNYRYKVESLVRNRVRKKLGEDVDVLRENFPEVFEMVESEVCDSAVGAEAEELRDRLDEVIERIDDVDGEGAREAAMRARELLEEEDA